jgi:ParB-like chromosome segregation protein Spo0J
VTKQEVQQIQLISVYDLVPNPQNFYEVNDIEKLAIEIELQGEVITPLEVKAVDNGKFMIIAGHRRREAVLFLLSQVEKTEISKMMPCYVRKYATEKQELTALILSNRTQRVRTKTEELKEYQLLKPIIKQIFGGEKALGNVTGRFRAFCAEFFGVSESTIQRMDSLEKLSPELQEEVGKGNITPTAASELTSLSVADQKAVYEDTTKQGAATVKAVQEKKKEVVQSETEQPEMSEIEIKVFAINKIRTIILREIEKIPINNQDYGRVTVNNIKLDRLNLLKQVLENELNSYSGENMFESEEKHEKHE